MGSASPARGRRARVRARSRSRRPSSSPSTGGPRWPRRAHGTPRPRPRGRRRRTESTTSGAGRRRSRRARSACGIAAQVGAAGHAGHPRLGAGAEHGVRPRAGRDAHLGHRSGPPRAARPSCRRDARRRPSARTRASTAPSTGIGRRRDPRLEPPWQVPGEGGAPLVEQHVTRSRTTSPRRADDGEARASGENVSASASVPRRQSAQRPPSAPRSSLDSRNAPNSGTGACSSSGGPRCREGKGASVLRASRVRGRRAARSCARRTPRRSRAAGAAAREGSRRSLARGRNEMSVGTLGPPSGRRRAVDIARNGCGPSHRQPVWREASPAPHVGSRDRLRKPRCTRDRGTARNTGRARTPPAPPRGRGRRGRGRGSASRRPGPR